MLSATIEGETITFTATVPTGTWFGLGFGKNATRDMIGADIILFNATQIVDPDPAKTVVGAFRDVLASDHTLPGDVKDPITT